MSAIEKKDGADTKEFYGSPEIVCMGDALELTGGGDGVLADGGMKPNGYKEVVSEPSSPPTTPTTQPPSPKPSGN